MRHLLVIALLLSGVSSPTYAQGIPVLDVKEPQQEEATPKAIFGTRVVLHCTNDDPQKAARNFRIADDGSWFEDEKMTLKKVVDDALWLYQSEEHEILKSTTMVQFRPFNSTLDYSIHGKNGDISTNRYSCIAFQSPFKF